MGSIVGRQDVASFFAWGATGAAVIGLAWIAARAETPAATLLAVSSSLALVAASWISGRSTRLPEHRTFGAAAGVGMSTMLVLIGLVSFGFVLVPSTVLWLATLQAVPKPPQTARWVRSGLVVGSAMATALVLLSRIG